MRLCWSISRQCARQGQAKGRGWSASFLALSVTVGVYDATAQCLLGIISRVALPLSWYLPSHFAVVSLFRSKRALACAFAQAISAEALTLGLLIPNDDGRPAQLARLV